MCDVIVVLYSMVPFIYSGDSSGTEGPSSVRSVEETEGNNMGGSTANESKWCVCIMAGGKSSLCSLSE